MSQSKPKVKFLSIENFKQILFMLCLIGLFRVSVASLYQVPTASMEPTIKVGDRLLAFKLAYNLQLPFIGHPIITWGDPKRGDIVVFRYPVDTDIDFVKRIVGLPGDHLRVENRILFVNDVAQPRTIEGITRDILSDTIDHPEQKDVSMEKLGDLDHWVIQNKSPEDTPPQSIKFPPDAVDFVVPADTYFMMGDNRDNSADSRYWGTVKREYIQGKAIFVVWSFFKFDDNYIPHFRWDRIGHMLK